jgi:Fur family peroxide stress response transcriptional regulator
MDAEAIKLLLEGSGLRCTPQRYAVMAFLMEHNRHPTAVEIFEAVNRVDPRSSRATTYNNLRDLVKAGLVREVAIEGRAARFDAKGMRHHHFICDRCGNVEDMEWYDVPRQADSSRMRAHVPGALHQVCSAASFPLVWQAYGYRIDGASARSAQRDCANGFFD